MCVRVRVRVCTHTHRHRSVIRYLTYHTAFVSVRTGVPDIRRGKVFVHVELTTLDGSGTAEAGWKTERTFGTSSP